MLEIKHASTRAVLLHIEADTWEGRNLTGANLDEGDLVRLRLTHSSLRLASLRRADLTAAVLQNVCLDGADLERAVLAGSDLTSATLLATKLPRADLRKAILRYANLAGASFEGANLQGADLSMADARANFRNACLCGCDLRGANLAGANLQQADLTGADLTGANLAGAVLVAAKLQGAKMPPMGDSRLPAARIASAESQSSAAGRPSALRPPNASSGRQPAPSDLAPGPAGSPEVPAGKHRSRRSRSGHSPPVNPKQPGADWMRTTGPDFDSLLVSCPQCGLSTRLGAEHLDANYRCRGCQAVFTLDKAGKPKPQRTKKGKQPVVPWEARREPSRTSTRLTQLLLLLLALVTLGGLTAVGWRLAPSFMTPASLSDRSLAAAEAYVLGDVDRLTLLARKDSGPLVQQWLGRRPNRWDHLPSSSSPHFRVQKLNQGAASALASVEATLPALSGAAENAEHVILQQTWILEESGGWLLDVTATLASAPPRY